MRIHSEMNLNDYCFISQSWVHKMLLFGVCFLLSCKTGIESRLFERVSARGVQDDCFNWIFLGWKVSFNPVKTILFRLHSAKVKQFFQSLFNIEECYDLFIYVVSHTKCKSTKKGCDRLSFSFFRDIRKLPWWNSETANMINGTGKIICHFCIRTIE